MGRSKNGGVRGHILLLAAMHPELKMAPEVQEFVTTFQQQHPGTWREAQSPNRDVADGWDARIRLIDDQTAPTTGNGFACGAVLERRAGLRARAIRLHPSSSEAHRLSDGKFSSRGLAAPHREYVVSVARRRDTGRHLGPGSFIPWPTFLPGPRYCNFTPG